MNEKPVEVHNFRHVEHSFRETNTSKFIGPKVISPSRWLSEKQRINETMEKNQILFCEAYDDKNKVFKFRDRKPQLEIQPEMKFTAKSTMEKIADALMTNNMYGE